MSLIFSFQLVYCHNLGKFGSGRDIQKFGAVFKFEEYNFLRLPVLEKGAGVDKGVTVHIVGNPEGILALLQVREPELGIAADAPVTFADNTARFFLPEGLQMVKNSDGTWKVTQ